MASAQEPPAKRQRADDIKLGCLEGREAELLTAGVGHLTAKAQDVDHVVFHGRCPDGFVGAYAAWLALGDQATYVGIGHGSREDKIKACGEVKGKHVAVVDFSFDAETTQDQLKQAASYVVLDHHASAEGALKGLPAENKVFEMKQSGATLAWDFWHPGKECPLLLRYIEDKDIWRWAMHSSKEFSAVFELGCPIPEPGPLSSPSKDFEALDKLVKGGEESLLELLQKGRAVLQYQNQVVEQHKKRAVLRRLKAFPDIIAAVVNATVLASEIGNAITQIEGANFAMVIQQQPNGERAISVSARSCFPSEGQADVSLISKHFGGGGHRAASGFGVKGESIEEVLLPYDPIDVVPGAREKLSELEAFAMDASKAEGALLDFPAGLSAQIRKMLHGAADKLGGLKSESVGSGAERFLRITKVAKAAP